MSLTFWEHAFTFSGRELDETIDATLMPVNGVQRGCRFLWAKPIVSVTPLRSPDKMQQDFFFFLFFQFEILQNICCVVDESF